MNDLTGITAVLAGLKTAADIARTLSQSDVNLERAELKNKLAEMYETLAAARMSAVDLKETLQEKDNEIARLLDAVSIKAEVVKVGDGYFKKNVNGKPTGDPFCVYCWDTKKVLIHIHRAASSKGPDLMMCPSCRTAVQAINIHWGAIENN